MRLYVAYGSNLNKRHMRQRCPAARPVGKIMLTNSKLVFRGVADLEYDPTSSTPCGVWEVTPDCERALDRYEGVGSGFYYRDLNIRLRFRGKPQRALVYLMGKRHQGGIYPPSQHYLDTIRQGYEDFGLDTSFLDEAVEHAFNYKNPDKQTRERRERQLKSLDHVRLVKMPEAVALRRMKINQGEIVPPGDRDF